MIFSFQRLVLWTVWTVSAGLSYADVDDLSGESADFWNRILHRYKHYESVSFVPPPEPKVDCFVRVELDCRTERGLECEQLRAPDPVCSERGPIEAVTFRYENNRCDPSQNGQMDEAYCEDTGPIGFNDPVVVSCATEIGEPLLTEPRTVVPGGTFTVSKPGSLPSKIDCSFSDGISGQLQRNIVDTSGSVRLFLQDRFGAFTLVSCNAKTCLETLAYDVDMTNVGKLSQNMGRGVESLIDRKQERWIWMSLCWISMSTVNCSPY